MFFCLHTRNEFDWSNHADRELQINGKLSQIAHDSLALCGDKKISVFQQSDKRSLIHPKGRVQCPHDASGHGFSPNTANPERAWARGTRRHPDESYRQAGGRWVPVVAAATGEKGPSKSWRTRSDGRRVRRARLANPSRADDALPPPRGTRRRRSIGVSHPVGGASRRRDEWERAT